MKKSKIYIVLIVLLCITVGIGIAKFATSATDEIPTPVVTEAVEVESTPTEEEIVTEGENSATEETPTLTTDKIVEWVFENYEEITVIFAVISAALLIVARLTDVIKSIVTCNNNSVAVAEESKETTQAALDEVKTVKDVVGAYKEEMANLLAEVRQSDEEKKNLKMALDKVEDFLKTAKLANTELANEVAELLVLANIPNAKKEELYSRHRAAVDAIDAVDHKKTEVKEDVGEDS